MTELSEEEKKATGMLEYIKEANTLIGCNLTNRDYLARILLNLIRKQDTEIQQVLDDYQELGKDYHKLECASERKDTEINKLNNVIEEYEKECRQFKAFCRKIRRDDKHDVDEFNQGQEQKCNQFLNLLAGEKHWTYEGKYFDETDKQIEKMKEDK